MNMIEGQNYSLYINGIECNAKLKKICTYTSMPKDYLFTPLKGEIPIISITEGENYFPIPQFMLDMMNVSIID